MEQTKIAVERRKTIFHGNFKNEHFITNIECLEPVRDGEGWILWDFRPIGSMKLEILKSLFFQKKILESLGMEVHSSKVIRIQTSYEYLTGEEIETDKYLFVEDVTERLVRENERFEEEWSRFQSFLTNMEFPVFSESHTSCNSPKTCYLKDTCFSRLENGDVFELREGYEIAKKHYLEGKIDLGSLPEEDLSPIQRIQRNAHLHGTAHYDLPQLTRYFERTTEKVAFLDFESVNPLLPMFTPSRPFQHIPFLFSLHIWDSRKDELEYHTYIHPPEKGDPRAFILEELAKRLPVDITIFSFNDFFEKLIIEEATQVYPNFKDWWENIRPNFIDLALPFKKFWVYHPEQKGKASLKEILPTMSDVSHGNLSIKEGQDANYQYLRLLKKQVTEEEKFRVLEDLVNYCKMDTYGLFLIYRKLKNHLSISQC